MTARGLSQAFVFVMECSLIAAIALTVTALSCSCGYTIRVHTTVPNAPDYIAPVQAVWAEPDLRESTEYAVAWWNDEIGVDCLRMVDTFAEADISVVAGAAVSRKLGTGNPASGLILVRIPVDTYRIIRHELGHAAFWLDHDDLQPTSVMYPSLDTGLAIHPRDSWGQIIPEPRFYLMPEDKAAIRRRIE